jgi:ABC-type transport system substrate-binding protein
METRRLIYVLTGIAVATVVVIGVLVVATAGGGDGDSSASNGNGDGNGDGQPEDTGPDLPDRVEGELRLFGADPITMDPACASDAGSAEYIVEIFSGLVGFDDDLNVVGDIAERWDTNPDNTVYTFHLRPNVLFHDSSRRVTAGDFKYSLERALNPDTLSTVGEVYLDDIVGAEEYADGGAEEVTGIRVLDDNTLEITINEPSSFFLYKLTYPTAYVVDQREVRDATCFEGAEWTLRPNGTGPFRLQTWELGERIELAPNENYYLDPKPSLEQVTYLLAGGSALTMYENDEIDLTGVGVNDIERISDPNEPLNAEFHQFDSLDVFYIGFNTGEPPFDDVKVRQALAMAIDKELLANEILAGLVSPAKGVLPPGMKGYDADLEGLPYDPEAAADLLDEAGGPEVLEGVTILSTGRGASPSDVVEAIVAMWDDALGVTVEIEQQDSALFFQSVQDHEYQIASLGWIADYPDPQNFLDLKLHSQSPINDQQYSNSEVDSLLDRARTELDEAARLELYRQAEALIVQDAPWIPLSHSKPGILIKPYVKGYETPPFVVENLRDVTIER